MSTYQPALTSVQIEQIGRKIASDRLEAIEKLQAAVRPKNTFYTRYGKRMLDIIISLLMVVVTLPINLIIAFVTLLDVGRPIMFKQQRSGRNGVPFDILKFRNMRDDRDGRGELLPPEQRVTRWGRFVRKTSLDELLNFWSVLRGDMSLIGPRPLPPIYLERFSKRHKARLAVRPGLECPPSDLSRGIWSWNDQLENDVWYVEHISFRTDCKMAVQLVRFALDAKSANARALASRGSFMGYDLNGRAINDAEIPEEYLAWIEERLVGRDDDLIGGDSDK